MTSKAIQQYEAALQLLINKRPASSGLKICCDDVAKAALQKSSYSDKPDFPKAHLPENQVKNARSFKDDMNS